MNFKLGSWYESKDQVRAHYRQYRKGILRRDGQLAIIFEYTGFRRQHYGESTGGGPRTWAKLWIELISSL